VDCPVCDKRVSENTPFRYDSYLFCSQKCLETCMQDMEEMLDSEI